MIHGNRKSLKCLSIFSYSEQKIPFLTKKIKKKNMYF